MYFLLCMMEKRIQIIKLFLFLNSKSFLSSTILADVPLITFHFFRAKKDIQKHNADNKINGYNVYVRRQVFGKNEEDKHG